MHFHRLERYWRKNPPEHMIGQVFIRMKEPPTPGYLPMTRISPSLDPADQAKALAPKAPAASPLKALAEKGKHGALDFDELARLLA